MARLDAIPGPPRHVTLSLARVPRRGAGVHPDESATLRLSWERARGDDAWRFAGTRPRVRSRRGSFTATVCLPAGTNGLAWVDALVLWRPHLPWADEASDAPSRPARGGPGDHETGRQTYRYRREPDGSWRFLGAHEGGTP